MRVLTFLELSFAASLLCIACSQFGNTNSGKTNLSQEEVAASIPLLLDRNEALRLGKEWDNVQNIYGTQRQAIIANPAALEPRLKLAELFIQEARVTGEHPHYYPAALKMLNEVLARIPQDDIAKMKIEQKDLLFRSLSAKAGVQLSLHDFSGALVTANEAVKINPYNAQIYGALVDAHVEMGHYAKAVEMADKMVSVRPDLRSYSRVSYLREIHGDVSGAIEALDMAVKAGFPGQEATAWARLTLGNIHKTYGDWKKAETQYQMILLERENYPFALAMLAEVEIQKKQYDKAEMLLKNACDIAPEVSFYETLAMLYSETGRMEEYRAIVSQILQMMQEDTEKGHNMSMEMAEFYLRLQPDYDKALQLALSEYSKRPDNIDVNRLMAKIYIAKKDSSKAREHLAKAATTGSRHPELVELKKMLGG